VRKTVIATFYSILALTLPTPPQAVQEISSLCPFFEVGVYLIPNKLFNDSTSLTKTAVYPFVHNQRIFQNSSASGTTFILPATTPTTQTAVNSFMTT